MTATHVLEASDIHVRFRGVQALRGASLSVAPGERVGLIGPNGAGKSTLLGVIAGQTRPARGSVALRGADVTSASPQARARMGLARTFQDGRPFGSLTALETLRVAAMKRIGQAGSGGEDLIGLLAEVGLDRSRHVLSSGLSYADRKRLEVARALATRPTVILLDEPFSGLSRRESDAMLLLLDRTARDRQLALVFVEHIVRLVLDFCPRVVVLDRGAVIADASPQEVRQDRAVIAAYLGTGQASRGPDPRQVTAPSPAPTPGIALEARRVTIARGNVDVVRGVDLALPIAEARSLVGPNGAGKTTLMEGLAGLIPVREGAVSTATGSERVRLVHQGRGLFPLLSVRDNLLLGAYHAPRREVGRALDAVLELFAWMPERLHLPAANLSGGEQQMLAIARALMARPDVLLLDEPSIGVAPVVIEQMVAVVRRLIAAGTAVLISEQVTDYVADVASYGYVMELGEVVREGSAARMSWTGS